MLEYSSEVLLFDQRGFVDSHCYNQGGGGGGGGKNSEEAGLGSFNFIY
jgi:hypothetical protein